MIYLFLSLLFSLLIVIVFKIFPYYKIKVSQSIIINYVTASICGFISMGEIPTIEFYTAPSWFYISLISGLFLILVFHVFAASAAKAGVAITAVSSKMSVIIPVIAGFFLFNESMPLLKITGIVLVMFSFYLIFKNPQGYSLNKRHLILPLLLFIGNGINDSVLKYAQFNHFHAPKDSVHFLTSAFSVSCVLGLLFFLVQMTFRKEKIHLKSLLAGIGLGLLNWFSTLFFLNGLELVDVSIFIPVFNAGIVILGALSGMILFREKLHRVNIIGIILSVVAISLIVLTN